MRFTVAWANVVSENTVLKLALACMTVVFIGLSFVTIRLSSKKPLVIERGCFSKSMAIADGERTASEIEIFVREALSIRFDTLAHVKPDFLSQDEEKFRVQEQLEMKKRDLSQKIIVNSVSVNGDKVMVNADRLFTVGNVRSALPFPLTVTLGTIARREWNPYGLTILQVSAPKSDVNSKGDKN